MNDKIKCLIVDDEPLALAVLEKYIYQLDNLALVGKCGNALEAFHFMQEHPVDLLFLDIMMPRLGGIDLLKTMVKRPKVIFTTAFREYALEAFDLNVLDYLLKPISFERFLTAISKYAPEREVPTKLPSLLMSSTVSTQNDNFIYVKSEKRMIKILLKDVLYLESLSDYVKLITTHGEILTNQRITYLETKLPDDQFLRIHRSFIIAVEKIVSFTASTIEIGKRELPIGRFYKNEVMQALGMGKQLD